jgi:hypothetical protein
MLLGGPIQDYQHQHLATAMGPLVNVDIANQWALQVNQQNHPAVAMGPFRNINIITRRWLWAHLRMATLLLGGPIQDCRHRHSAMAVGPHVNVDIATRWTHSGLSTSLFGDGCGPTHKCRHCQSASPFEIIDIIIQRRLCTDS